MATQSILVEDCSPLIQYTPPNAWQDAQPTDALVASYSGASYHATSTQGATATFQFRGTGFKITGGRRQGYGSFSVTLDGKELFDGNPAPAASPVNTLATVSGLTDEQHTVVLTNTGGGIVDIDAISFETQIDPSSKTTIDDSDPRIQYLPSGSWGVNRRSEFQNGTLHFSQAPDASASVQFTGNAIAVYGTVSPDHADFSVTIDGKTVTMPSHSSSRVFAVRTQILLYWADQLADGQHTLTVQKVQGGNTGPFVDIDSFATYTSNQTERLPKPSAAPSTNTSRTSNHTAVIAGASVAGVVALALIAVGLFLFLRHRRKRHKPGINKSSISPITPILPMQGVMESGLKSPSNGESAFPFPPSAPLAPVRKTPFMPKRSSQLSIAPSYYGDPDFGGAARSLPGQTTQMTSVGSAASPPVPRLAKPRTPGSPQTVPTVVVTDTLSPSQSPRPSRPRRPPTLNIGSLQ